jgi:hypothetical protein
MVFFFGRKLYLVSCCLASKVWNLLLAYFPFSLRRELSQTGWASFLLLHTMHCKYGFMRSLGEWKGKWLVAFNRVDLALSAVEG